MKTVIGTFLALGAIYGYSIAPKDTTITQNKMEQTENKSMATEKEVFNLNENVIINISAEKLWKIVGYGFGETGKWATIVDHSTGSGESMIDGAPHNERTCTINDEAQSEVKEKIVKYSNMDMNLVYEVTEGLNPMMLKSRSEWTVESVSDNQSKMIVKMEFWMKGPMEDEMKGQMNMGLKAMADQFLTDIRIYAETGKVSEAKQIRMDALSKM